MTKSAPDEDVQLAELDLLDVVEVAGRPQDHEQRVAVALELRALVGVDRVLDGEFVQVELRGERLQFERVGPVEPDPGHAVGLVAQRREASVSARWRALPLAVGVDGAVDDARCACPGSFVVAAGRAVVVVLALAASPDEADPRGEVQALRHSHTVAVHDVSESPGHTPETTAALGLADGRTPHPRRRGGAARRRPGSGPARHPGAAAAARAAGGELLGRAAAQHGRDQHRRLHHAWPSCTPRCTRLRDQVQRLAERGRARRHRQRQRAAVAAEDFGLTALGRYSRMQQDYRSLVDEQLICGLQVHVGVDDRDVAVRVAQRVEPGLPALLAMSASSPYLHGNDTGYSSFRSMIWQRWPTAGSFGHVETRRRVRPAGRRTSSSPRSSPTPKMAYFDVRPPAHVPTVELRVCDAMPARSTTPS